MACPKSEQSRHQLYLYAKKEQGRGRKAAWGIHKATGVCVSPVKLPHSTLACCSSNGCSCLTPFTHSGSRQGAKESPRRRSQIVDLLAICCSLVGQDLWEKVQKKRVQKKDGKNGKLENWVQATWDGDSLYNFLEVLNEATKESKASQVFPNFPPPLPYIST